MHKVEENPAINRGTHSYSGTRILKASVRARAARVRHVEVVLLAGLPVRVEGDAITVRRPDEITVEGRIEGESRLPVQGGVVEPGIGTPGLYVEKHSRDPLSSRVGSGALLKKLRVCSTA